MMSTPGAIREDALHVAAADGDVPRIIEALKGVADVDVRNDKGWTALMFAARNGHIEAIKVLVDNGCDTMKVNSVGQTAHDIAEFWQHHTVATYLSNKSSTSGNQSPVLPIESVHNYFCDSPLDRMAQRRSDETWLRSLIEDPSTIFLLFINLQPLGHEMDRAPHYTLALFSYRDDFVKKLLDSDATVVFLGVDSSNADNSAPIEASDRSFSPCVAWFVIDASSISTEGLETMTSRSSKPIVKISTRPGMLQLLRSEAAIAGQARSMLAWHERYKFCATCAGTTQIKDAGYKRQCIKEDCASNKGVHNTCYPRTDPTVIMAILSSDKRQLLLGRKNVFPSGMWSCLAGFMEPGEGIEEACRREVFEESGIKVGHVQYHSCQPWPMPSSLMIGCIGYAESSIITVDKNELEDVQWFSGQDVRRMISGQHPQHLFCPPEQAIAHQLIKHCINHMSKL